MTVAKCRYVVVVAAMLLAACQPLIDKPATEAPPPASDETETVEAAPEAAPDTPEDTATLECQCPPPPPPAPVVTQPCPPAPAEKPAPPSRKLLILGRVEYVFVKMDTAREQTLKLKTRVDSGAGLTSLHAENLVEFERDGDPWVRFSVPRSEGEPAVFERRVMRTIEIKQQSGEPQRRPVVRMGLQLGDIEENLEVSLTDRSGYLYPVLIGRNFLKDRAVVDVSRKFVADDTLYMH